jgi:hypothetical protein
LRAVTDPRRVPGVTIRWFTDADRQDMRDAAEERRVLDELVRKYTTYREITPEERAEAIEYAKKHGYVCKPLQIDPRWRD